MLGFLRLVATIAGCLSVGALAGAYLADRNGYNPYVFVTLGGVTGAYFGLAAAGEIRGHWLDPLLHRASTRCSCCERRQDHSLDQCRLAGLLPEVSAMRLALRLRR